MHYLRMSFRGDVVECPHQVLGKGRHIIYCPHNMCDKYKFHGYITSRE